MINSSVTQTGTLKSNTPTNTASSQGSHNISSGDNKGSSTAYGLEKGNVIKGEVIDLKNNEVTVKLADGQVLKAKLQADNSTLSIGSKVTFRVEDATSQSLTLKIIPESSASYLSSTIDKALEAANLGKTIRNRRLVSELLNARMSIDKNTLNLFAKQLAQFPDVSVKTLLFLQRYQLPVNGASIEIAEGFLHSDGKMIENLSTLSDNINQFLGSSSNVSAKQELLQILLGADTQTPLSAEIPAKENLLQGIPIASTAGTQEQMQAGNIAANTGNILFSELLNLSERTELAESLKTLPTNLISPEVINNVLNGTLDTVQATELTNILKAYSLLDPLEVKQPASDIMDKLLSISASDNKTLLKELLPAQDRGNLLIMLTNLLGSDNLPSSINNGVMDGSISARDLLSFLTPSLTEELVSQPAESSEKLLSSKEFHALLNSKLLSDWTLTPEDLNKPSPLSSHYESLLKQLNELNSIAEQGMFHEMPSLTTQLSHMTDTVQYMNMFQNMFSFLQLPVKLKNQFTDSELYVYSNKKSELDITKGVKIVLHLNMEHLGPLDVSVELTSNHLKNTFYLEDKDVLHLLSTHMEALEKKLSTKGYQVSTEFYDRASTPSPSEDILSGNLYSSGETSAENSQEKRYHFDIRA
ncbi:flagellar hook-length control protein FliK [Anaerocolumna sp. AGMB13020]|uniref:flagellar hook-length control protein FliK n=1 Tax=Anaerocolumna sp. AGMB13020 TaxID=3081750 RepID=UPI00295547DF|nr:flagellar hook-length control protein FliK [Anaerocolumna sp. AGMB13020]WOO35629.1 flagellar hook-length control protein FliK [Anaerocolumna sp. AGMB13020]